MELNNHLNLEDHHKEGPVRDRSCTDVICCVSFIAFWGCTIFVFMNSLQTGDLTKIGRPYDADGNACGLILPGAKNMSAYPFLFFNMPSISGGNILDRTVCVTTCPTATNQSLACMTTSNVSKCGDLTSYPTNTFLGKFCTPTDPALLDTIGSTFSGINLESSIQSIVTNKYVFLVCLGMSILLAFVYSKLMQYCTWLVVIASGIGIFVGGGFLSYLSWNRYKMLVDQPQAQNPGTQEQLLSNANFYKWIAIVLWVILGLLLLIVLCLYTRIKLAIHVIQSSGDFVSANPLIIITPVVLVLIGVVYFLFWMATTIYIFSTGEAYHNPNYPWGKIKWNPKLQYTLYFHGFGLLWNISFLLSASHFIICCSAAIWYFKSSREEFLSPIMTSVYWLVRYHLGSIAIGSLILAIVWALRIVAQYVHEKIKETNQGNLAECVAKMLICFVECLDRFVRFFNKHAYVEIAMRGTSFCASAVNGMKIVASNFLRFGVLHGIGEIVMNMGVLVICMAGTYLGYIIIITLSPFSRQFHQTAASVLVVLLINYSVGSLFAHIWEVSSDAILHCYCLDDELEKRTGGTAVHVTENLQKALAHSEQKKPEAPAPKQGGYQ